jgi:NADH-quinone oxidoreductase subunit L
MTRVMFMTFAGERRWDPDVHPHEVPPVMTSPMVLLAIGALGFGAFEVLNDRLVDFLGPVTGTEPPEPAVFSVAGIVALVLVIAAIGLAWAMYGRRPVAAVAPHGSPLTVAARKELYGNTVNESLLMRPGQWLTRLSVYFDNRGVDGLVNTIAATVGGTSGRVRRTQTGLVRSYALSMFVGAVLLVGALLLVRI